jgi:hypothetical protein
MRQYPRIELNPDAFNALQAEMLLTEESVREIASKAILGYVSEDALDVMRKKTARQSNQKTTRPADQQTIEMCATKRPDNQQTTYEECGTPEHSESKPKRKNLAKDDAALARIKEMWESGEHNREAIAKTINYPPSTVRDRVRKMLETGEIKEAEKKQPGETRADEQPGDLNNV